MLFKYSIFTVIKFKILKQLSTSIASITYEKKIVHLCFDFQEACPVLSADYIKGLQEMETFLLKPVSWRWDIFLNVCLSVSSLS